MKVFKGIKLECLALLLLTMDFYGLSDVIVVMLILYIIFKMIVRNMSIFIDGELLILFCFSGSYFLIYSLTNSELLINIVYYIIGPIGMYIAGKVMLSKDIEIASRQFVYLVIFIGVGYFTHGALNMYINITEGNFGNNTTILKDFWSQTFFLRTMQGLFFTVISSLFFAALIIGQNEIIGPFWRLMIICCSIFSMWSSFVLGNRTLLAIVLITAICIEMMYINLSKSIISSSVKILLVIFIIFLTYALDIGGIKSFISESSLYTRIEESSLNSPRWEYYKVFFNTFHLYPLGVKLAVSKDILPFTYMHNLWLDVYIDAGFIPFIFIVLFTVGAIYRILKLIQSKSIPIVVKIFVTSIFVGFFLNFMVEPIIEGNIYFFMTFCYVAGLLNSYLRIAK